MSSFIIFLIGIHSMQDLTATARHGVPKTQAQEGSSIQKICLE